MYDAPLGQPTPTCSNDRTPAWPADMSIPVETLGFLAFLSLGGDSRSLSGTLGIRLLFLCVGGVGIEYSLPTKKNNIIHASTQVFGLR
jgi:hypothetical protein